VPDRFHHRGAGNGAPKPEPQSPPLLRSGWNRAIRNLALLLIVQAPAVCLARVVPARADLPRNSRTVSSPPGAPKADGQLTPVRSFREFTRKTAPELPGSLIVDLQQDDQGVLWIATVDGLATYDGVNVHGIHGPAAPRGTVVLAHRGGAGVYAGSRRGVHVFDARLWRLIATPHSVLGVAELDGGEIWAAFGDRAWRLVPAQAPPSWQQVQMSPGVGRVTTLISDGTGGALILGTGQALRCRSGSCAPVAGGAPPPAGAAALLVTREGSVLLGTLAGKLVVAHAGQRGWAPIDLSPWQSAGIRSLAEDRRGRVWVGGNDGRLIFGKEGGAWQSWGIDNGLPGSGVLSILADREGTLWLGLNGGGLLQWVGEAWSHRGHWSGDRSSSQRAPVTGLAATSEGGFLASVWGKGIWHWNGREMSQWGKEQGLTEDIRTAVEPVPGMVWAAARRGIFESAHGGSFRKTLRLSSGLVQGFAREQDGHWYAFTSHHGIFRRLATGWTPAADLNLLLDEPDVRAMAWVGDGELWIGTSGSLIIRRRDGSVRRFKLGLERNLPETILSIFEAGPGEVWIGGNSAIRVFGPGKDRLLTRSDGIPGNVVSLQRGPDGSVWAGGSLGLGRYAGGHWTVYDASNGLLSDECNGTGALFMPGGSVLVATYSSLARFDGSIVPLPAPPLRVFWREIPAATAGNVIRLRADDRRLHVSWSAPWLAPRAVEFRTRLGGPTSSWSPPTGNRELQIESLPTGNWELGVEARLAGSGDSGWTPPLTARIEVAPLFRETTWAKGLTAVLLVATALAGVRVRTRGLARRAANLDREVRQRTCELLEANRQLEEAKQQLTELACRDGLTGLYNRRTAEERLSAVLAAAARRPVALAVLLFDIDHFKQVNDGFGHEAGDEVLKAFSRCASAQLRGSEFLARFGGEEFLIILEGEDLEGASIAAERLRQAVEELRVDVGDRSVRVTISGGAAAPVNAAHCVSSELLAAADRGLYAAKRAGRNRIFASYLDWAAPAIPEMAGGPPVEDAVFSHAV
jgi:diguanylate cyclase (GGDEF)-like protein